jgi:hypothetical protein
MPKKNKSKSRKGQPNGRNPKGHPSPNRIKSASEPPIRYPPLNFAGLMQRAIDLPRAKKQGIMGRHAIASNIPAFTFETVAKGTPARGDADLHALTEGYYSKKNNMSGLPRAKVLNPMILSTKPVATGPIGAQQLDSNLAGTTRMINKNGSRVPIGNTDPRLSSRSTFSMLDEVDQIIANPRSTAADYERVRQLLRMVTIRNQIEDDEYRARHPPESAHGTSRFRDIREHVENIYRRLRNTTSSLTERASSGVRGILQGAVERIRGVNGGRVINRRVTNGGRHSRSRSRTPGGTRKKS